MSSVIPNLQMHWCTTKNCFSSAAIGGERMISCQTDRQWARIAGFMDSGYEVSLLRLRVSNLLPSQLEWPANATPPLHSSTHREALRSIATSRMPSRDKHATGVACIPSQHTTDFLTPGLVDPRNGLGRKGGTAILHSRSLGAEHDRSTHDLRRLVRHAKTITRTMSSLRSMNLVIYIPQVSA